MRLEYYPVEKLEKELLGLIGTYVDLRTHRVFFFGSRVDGTSDDRSDIDVGIEGPELINWTSMASIRAAIESIPTLYTIQAVDFKSVAPTFRTVALQHIEVINDPADSA